MTEKIKILKDITIENLRDAGATKANLLRFAFILGNMFPQYESIDTIKSNNLETIRVIHARLETQELDFFFKDTPCFKNWLIVNNFIKAEEEYWKEIVKRGDKFKRNGVVYQIVQVVINEQVFISLNNKNGFPYANGRSVKNSYKITRDEFKGMIASTSLTEWERVK